MKLLYIYNKVCSIMSKCEMCGKEHDGKFATGRFCSRSCSNKFSTKDKRLEINKKVSKTLTGKSSPKKGISQKTGKPFEKNECLYCGKVIHPRNKYCSKICEKDFHKMSKTAFQNYRVSASFKFNIYDYPEYFDLSLIEKFGLYSAKNKGDNPNGIVRDHILSVKDGFELNIDPLIISHPANCKLIRHIDNCRKRSKSNITYEELLLKINEFEKK